ncbi:MAG: hypothetical protein K8J09_09710 [Planctomycetes bacterium]|nr:hypothetical protein [Planctomycetota bacterium]
MRQIPITATLTLLASTLAAQNVVLPDNHYLGERSDQLANTGDTTHWRTTAGRMQVLYEASHFLNAGVTGPVLVTHVKFRGEDGEPNLGGQAYAGVTIEVGSTTLTAAAMSTTFLTNRAPVAPATTTMGPLGTTTVTVAPSLGTCPNNYCIDIDLTAIGATFIYDPTGAEPNLLIDILMPTAPANAAPLYMIPIQDTTASGAGIRGKSVCTATVASLTGTADTTPCVVGIEFAGPGGYGNMIPATNEEYGAACGGACSTYYQTFNQGQAFDLTGLTMIPDNPTAPNYYHVVGGAPAIDLTKINAVANSIVDEGVYTHPLSFTWNYPGGSTTTLKPTTNGSVWLDAAMTSTMYTTNKPSLLGTTTNYTARYMPFWSDLHAGRNTLSNPQAGLHVFEDTTGGPGNTVVYVTWNDVGWYRLGSSTTTQPGHSSLNFQVVMHEATGMVEYRYGSMSQGSSIWTTSTSMHYSSIVGFTRGRIGGTTPSQDPQSRDLSVEVPFDTAIEGTTSNAGLSAVSTPIAGGVGYFGRMFAGQSVTWNVSNIPAGTVVALLNIDLAASTPGIQIPTITAPGCMMSTSISPLFLGYEVWLLPASSVTGVVPVTIPPGVFGLDVYAQAIGLDLWTGGNLIPWSTQSIKHTVGLN